MCMDHVGASEVLSCTYCTPDAPELGGSFHVFVAAFFSAGEPGDCIGVVVHAKDYAWKGLDMRISLVGVIVGFRTLCQ